MEDMPHSSSLLPPQLLCSRGKVTEISNLRHRPDQGLGSGNQPHRGWMRHMVYSLAQQLVRQDVGHYTSLVVTRPDHQYRLVTYNYYTKCSQPRERLSISTWRRMLLAGKVNVGHNLLLASTRNVHSLALASSMLLTIGSTSFQTAWIMYKATDTVHTPLNPPYAPASERASDTHAHASSAGTFVLGYVFLE